MNVSLYVRFFFPLELSMCIEPKHRLFCQLCYDNIAMVTTLLHAFFLTSYALCMDCECVYEM